MEAEVVRIVKVQFFFCICLMAASLKAEEKMPEVNYELLMSRMSGMRNGIHYFTSDD